MNYISTRDKTQSVSGAKAIVQGLSSEGGLFVPSTFPQLTKEDFDTLASQDYAQRANFIIGKFLPELAAQLPEYTAKAYAKFDEEDPAPLVKVADNTYLLELWHGPTYAFKDIALTLLPHLLVGSKAVLGEKDNTLILVATSGDTGKAALEGFKDVQGTSIVVLYPQDGVSNLQKLQMQTTTGNNVKVLGIKGNFDDAQTAVKNIFTDKTIGESFAKKGIALSSANSINFGRLVPQITYYFSAYADMLNAEKIKLGDKVNFCVPTGNFGNILAGYYAYKMGLPVNKFICASNQNNVLADFFKTGTYSVENRAFHKTSSPSMDILISSNLERLIFEFSNRDDVLTNARMADLKNKGAYSVSAAELKELQKLFVGGFASEEEVFACIDETFDTHGYIADTHTAVALSVYQSYASECGDKTPTVAVSTASPYKFVADVLVALGEKPTGNDKKDVEKLEDVTALPIPDSLNALFSLKKLHDKVVDKTAVTNEIMGCF